MPIYEYECNDCGHQFEAIQKMSDDVLTECPECNKAALRKLVSAPAFRLKGQGWYETDFKDGGKKNLSSSDSADKSTAPGAGKKAEGKVESKDKVAKPEKKAATNASSSKPAPAPKNK